MSQTPHYIIRFFFEWTGGYLWSGNDAARSDFGFGPIEDSLPLSSKLRDRGETLSIWHDTALNWDYPPDPGPWRQEECDHFNRAAREFFAQIQIELGEDFEVVYQQHDLAEDPDLDAYLKDPKAFKR